MDIARGAEDGGEMLEKDELKVFLVQSLWGQVLQYNKKDPKGFILAPFLI